MKLAIVWPYAVRNLIEIPISEVLHGRNRHHFGLWLFLQRQPNRKITCDVYVQFVIDIKHWSRFIDDLYRLDLTRLQLESCTFCCFARTQNRVEVQIKSQNTSDLSKMNQPSAYWEYILRWIIHYTPQSIFSKTSVTHFGGQKTKKRWQNFSQKS